VISMPPTHFDQTRDLVILGLPVRTSAASAAADIPAHWQRFMQSDLAARAPDADVFAVYCDYESDAAGPYTMVLGVAVAPDAPVPAGLRRVRIPAGEYARFSAQGHPAEVVWKTWAHVNGAWDGRPKRRYIADFERYTRAAMTPTSVAVDVAVGVQ